MAAENIKSTEITNSDATPVVKNNSYKSGGLLRSHVAVCAKAGAGGNGSTYRFCRLPSNARIHGIKLLNDALAGATSAKIGLYDVNGGAVVVDNCYATALDISTGTTTGTEVLFQAKSIANAEKRVWEDAGLSADTNKQYDLTLTLTTAGAAAGNMVLQVTYSE